MIVEVDTGSRLERGQMSRFVRQLGSCDNERHVVYAECGRQEMSLQQFSNSTFSVDFHVF